MRQMGLCGEGGSSVDIEADTWQGWKRHRCHRGMRICGEGWKRHRHCWRMGIRGRDEGSSAPVAWGYVAGMKMVPE